jgi:hypothetical protein
MSYTGKTPVDYVDIMESQSLVVLNDLTVDTNTLYVDSTNNRVGIGTSLPASALDVTGTVTADSVTADVISVAPTTGFANIEMGGPSGAYIDMKAPFSDDYDGRIIHDGSNLTLTTSSGGGNLLFKVADQTKMSVISTGINVTGTVTADGLTVSSGSNQITLDTGDQTTYGRLDVGHFSNGAFIGTYAGTNAAANVMRFGTSGTERMRIDSSGNVGIGTSSPASFGATANGLTINGTTNSNIIWQEGGSNKAFAYTNANDFIIGSEQSGGNTIFTAAGSERMRIDSSGRVGIGTTSPSSIGGSSKLVVNQGADGHSVFVRGGSTRQVQMGTTSTTGYINTDNTSGLAFHVNGSERVRISTVGDILIGNTGDVLNNGGTLLSASGSTYSSVTNTSNTLHVFDRTNSLYTFYVGGDGGIRNYAANNYNLSDQREKKNITDAASTWTDIRNFSIKEFHYNYEDDADPKKIGVIAQDVQQINPDLISTFNVDDDTQRLAVKEQQITWIAIKALQEAITKIEDLEARLATLETN